MKKIPAKNSIILFLTALIWGIAFVAQQVGMDYVKPFAFIASRFFLGSAVLIPVILVLERLKTPEQKMQEDGRLLWLGGGICGLLLFMASSLQQVGIQYTTVGKAGFITALYILIVPIFGLFLKKRAGVKLWISVVISMVGLYLLCMTDSLTLDKGDSIVLFCAIVFSLHILVIDHFSPKVDGVKMACIQFFIAATLGLICMLIFEPVPELGQLYAARMPILYTGILSSGVAYTLQIIGQKNVNPTIASLILSLESVISVVAAWILLGQGMSPREISGCVLMFGAIILAQLPERQVNKKAIKRVGVAAEGGGSV